MLSRNKKWILGILAAAVVVTASVVIAVREGNRYAHAGDAGSVAPQITAPTTDTSQDTNTVTDTSSDEQITPIVEYGRRFITRDQAINIALDQVPGASRKHLREVQLDNPHSSKPEYEIEIYMDGIKTEVEIDAYTGEVLEISREEKHYGHSDAHLAETPGTVATDPPQTAATEAPKPSTTEALKQSATEAPKPSTTEPQQTAADRFISMDEAVSIALAQVPGATSVHVEEVSFEWDDGRPEWDVEIEYGGLEYEIELDARDGRILEFKQEEKNKPYVEQPDRDVNLSDLLTREQAIAIALAQVPGATSTHVDEVSFEWDDGRPEWEVEIEYGGLEYDIELDARDGRILKIDIDD